MAVQEDYNSVIKWNRFLLEFVGCWPDSKNKSNTLSTCQFFTCVFMMFYFVMAPQMADLFIICRDVDSVIENLSNSNIAITNALIKVTVWWHNRSDLWKLIIFIKDDWEKPKTDMEYAEMIEVAKLGRSIAKGLTIMTQSNVCVCLSLQLYLNIAGIYPTRQLYFKSFYPYNTSVTPIYEITWISQLATGIISAVSYTSVDSFIGFSVLHVCGQLSILKNDLKQLLDSTTENNSCSLNCISQKLQNITQRHAHLINFAETIEDIFNVMFLVQMLSLTVQICLQLFQCISALSSEQGASFLQLFFMSLFMSCVILLFYIYCYVGEQLIVQTSEIRIAAYECEWYNLPITEIKALTFIILRTQKPPCITAGKFCPFTMVTFSEFYEGSLRIVHKHKPIDIINTSSLECTTVTTLFKKNITRSRVFWIAFKKLGIISFTITEVRMK